MRPQEQASKEGCTKALLKGTRGLQSTLSRYTLYQGPCRSLSTAALTLPPVACRAMMLACLS